MAEYIEREAAINAVVGLTIYEDVPSLNAAVEREYHNGREWIGGVRDAIVELGDVPAADVVEVVRCKDCVQWEEYDGTNGELNCGWCSEVLDRTTYCLFFCADGVRKDGGQDDV